jgi:hypothetical protein
MKRRGHPLREKVSRGEITLINPLDIETVNLKVSDQKKTKYTGKELVTEKK